MGWVPFKAKAQALQVRRVVQVITGENTEWIQLARSLVLRTLRRGQYQRDRVQWKAEDGMILSPINKVRGSKLLSRMLTTWNKIRALIKWDETGSELPSHLTILQVVHLMKWGDNKAIKEFSKIIGILRKAVLCTALEGTLLLESEGSWKSWLAGQGIFLEEVDNVRLQQVEEWVRSKRLEERNKHRFQNRRCRLPTSSLIQQIFKETDALPPKRISDSALQIITTARHTTGNWVLTWCRRQQNQRRRETDGEDYTQGGGSRPRVTAADRDKSDPRPRSTTPTPRRQGPTQSLLDSANSSEDRTEDSLPQQSRGGSFSCTAIE
ncbi:hypothetical protein R1sor_014953 [Riccia sorocarpa]|uniref:Uncharacterized protein n=1 Tax=Riccia sorocarpa TaxID=122646 RepID=A0ABD3HEQ2_9MARC